MKLLQPSNIVLVHGSDKEMKKLKDQLDKDIASLAWPDIKPTSVTMPANLASVTFQFLKQAQAELVGSLAEAAQQASPGSVLTPEEVEFTYENLQLIT